MGSRPLRIVEEGGEADGQMKAATRFPAGRLEVEGDGTGCHRFLSFLPCPPSAALCARLARELLRSRCPPSHPVLVHNSEDQTQQVLTSPGLAACSK